MTTTRNGLLAWIAALACAVLAACGSGTREDAAFPWYAFLEPPAEYRPWVRWWWPGGDVDPDELAREVDLLVAQGFGGAEIQALDAALDPAPADPDALARRRAFDTPAFWASVTSALQAARVAGLTVDLTLGTGWPTGGAHVAAADSMQTLLYSEDAVAGPATIDLALDGPDPTPFYTLAEFAAQIGEPLARDLTAQARLVAVVAGRVTGGARDTADLFNLTDVVTLDAASMVDLTDRVRDGRLRWDAPGGDWRVVGLWAAPDGQLISLAAAEGEGFVVDHLSETRVAANLAHLFRDETGLGPFLGTTVRGLFVDSFEMETERHFTDDLLAEFAKRRGYDVVPYLPFVMSPGADNHLFDGAGIRTEAPFASDPERDARVRHDYALTVSDLFVERFFAASSRWARERGLVARMQPYGIHVDVMRAAGAVDLPEAEQLFAGGSELFLKTVSSGAHQYGRPLVSAESMVWAGRDRMQTPRKLKAAADKLFTSGVNHVVYHGFPYRTGDAAYGDADWHPFSSPFGGTGTYSTHVGETDPFWADFDALNRYVGRCQTLLRLGRPRADVAVYYPWLGIPASLARADDLGEFLFGGAFEDEPDTGRRDLFDLVDGLFGGKHLGPVTDWLTAAWPILQDLENRGYTWEWANAEGLAGIRADADGVAVGANRFEALLVLDVRAMPPEVATGVAAAVEAGVPAVFLGEPPSAQPGFHQAQAGDAAVGQAMARVQAAARVMRVDLPDQVPDALVALGVEGTLRHREVPRAFRAIRRELDDGGTAIFVRNPEAQPRDLVASPDVPCVAALWADPWTGSVAVPGRDEAGRLIVPMAAYGSGFLLCDVPPPPAELAGELAARAVPASVAATVPVAGWTLEVDGAPVAAAAEDPDGVLGDWRDAGPLADASGPGVYRASVQVPAIAAGDRVFLDLGRVDGVARVRAGDRDLGTARVPPYRVEIPADLAGTTVALEVTLVVPARNGAIAAAAAGDPTVAQFAGKQATRIAAGLSGPIELQVRRAANTPE